MKLLEGKDVANKIETDFQKKLKNINIKPNIAILTIEGNDASNVYMKRIQKNCEKYGIGFSVLISKNENEFIDNFNKVKDNENITGVMFQQPINGDLLNLINQLPAQKDIEGIGINNMGKLFLGEKSALIPCTSRAVIEILDYYKIDLEGKETVIVGRSNIVGKPLIPQLLKKNATVTICHSKTENLREKTKRADIIIMAIGKANFLKKEDIKEGAVLIDVGINFIDGKITGDIDFESIKDKALACTPVPGGIGTVTNALLINNIIDSALTHNSDL